MAPFVSPVFLIVYQYNSNVTKQWRERENSFVIIAKSNIFS